MIYCVIIHRKQSHWRQSQMWKNLCRKHPHLHLPPDLNATGLNLTQLIVFWVWVIIFLTLLCAKRFFFYIINSQFCSIPEFWSACMITLYPHCKCVLYTHLRAKNSDILHLSAINSPYQINLEKTERTLKKINCLPSKTKAFWSFLTQQRSHVYICG